MTWKNLNPRPLQRRMIGRRQLLRAGLALGTVLMAPVLPATTELVLGPRRRGRTILRITTQGDLLEFSTQQLHCATATPVRVVFTNAAKYVNFDHNRVLLRPGNFDAVIAAAEQAGADHGWLPTGHPGIIASTTLAHRGQSVSVDFNSPAPGRYPYLCTVPGHATSMWGVLTVESAR